MVNLMAKNPVNLVVRFVLELAALVVLAEWGWQRSGWLLAILLPVIGATVWGVFRVPGDASHRGDAPVAVPGWVRLLLEIGYFGAAVLILAQTGQPRCCWASCW